MTVKVQHETDNDALDCYRNVKDEIGLIHFALVLRYRLWSMKVRDKLILKYVDNVVTYS